jgi:hypothetical protein
MSMRPSLEQMRQHVAELLETHEIISRCCRSPRLAWGARDVWEVHIPQIKSAVSYATCLHEIGHLLGRHQNSASLMVRERWAWRWAWRWAEQNALTWTPQMDRDRDKSLAWYKPRVRSIERKRAGVRLRKR